MKGTKLYRHERNPLEKQLHDSFVKKSLNEMEGNVFGTDERGRPKGTLSEREAQIVIDTIQWLGSPVGEGFLRENGFLMQTDF